MLTRRVEIVTVTTLTKDNWHDKMSRLTKQYPLLLKTELRYEEGKVEVMIDKIHAMIGKTMGKTKEELHKFIEAI